MTKLYRFNVYKFGCLAIPLDENGAPIGVALGYKHDLLPGEGQGRPFLYVSAILRKVNRRKVQITIFFVVTVSTATVRIGGNKNR